MICNWNWKFAIVLQLRNWGEILSWWFCSHTLSLFSALVQRTFTDNDDDGGFWRHLNIDTAGSGISRFQPHEPDTETEGYGSEWNLNSNSLLNFIRLESRVRNFCSLPCQNHSELIILFYPCYGVETKPNQFNRKARGISSVLKMLWIEWKWDERERERKRQGAQFWRVFWELILCYVNLLKTTEMKFWYSAVRKIPFNTQFHTPSLCSKKGSVGSFNLYIFPICLNHHSFLSFPHSSNHFWCVFSSSSTTRSSCCGRLKYLNGFDERSYT